MRLYMLAPYIAQLAIDLEIEEDMATESPNEWCVNLDKDISIIMREANPGFTLESPIAPVPQTNCEELFTDVMWGNLFGQGTGESTIGINADGQYFTLSRTIPYELNYNDFKDLLEDFANYVDFWQTEVGKHQRASYT